MSCGKTRTIEREHGVFVFPDTNGLFLGEKPQHLYSVDPHDRGVYRPGRISTCTRSPTARGSSPASQYARVPIQSLVEVAKDIQPQDHDLIRYAPRFEPRDAGRPRGINSKKEILMKRVILATIATTAFLVPAVAQQSSQISPRHLSESEVRKKSNRPSTTGGSNLARSTAVGDRRPRRRSRTSKSGPRCHQLVRSIQSPSQY